MGEIADMMINGSMCQYCGECFDDESGYPRSCESCREDEKHDFLAPKIKVRCPDCGKKVHESGLNQHIAAKHTGEQK